MPIQSMDALIAALPGQHIHAMKTQAAVTVAGQYHTLWDRAGKPGAGALAIGNVAAGLIPDKTTVGAIPFTNPAAGLKNYLARLFGTNASAGLILLYDRLYHAGSFGLGALGAQVLAAQPALTRPDGNGEDAEIWLEANVVFAAAATTIEVTYTNSAGVAGRTTGPTASLTGTPTGRMIPLPLQAGDTGVRKIESIIVGGAVNTGTVNVLILRRLTEITVSAIGIGVTLDAIALGMPEIPSDACLALAVLMSGASSNVPMLALDVVTG